MIDLRQYQTDEPGAEGTSGDPTPPDAAPEPSTDDLERIKGALDKERELRRQFEREQAKLQKRLNLYGDMDPEMARKAREAWEKQEQFERERAELEASIKGEAQREYETQLKQQQQAAAQYQQELMDYKRDVTLEREYINADGFPNEFDNIAHKLQRRVRWSKNGELVVLTPQGETAYIADNGQSRPMTLAELIAELKSQDMGFARHFKGQSRSGIGIYGDPTGTAVDDANMSDWDQVTAMREKGTRFR